LFAKLYSPPSFQDDFIGGLLRDFVLDILGRNLATHWFYIRYSDPEPHLRIRSKGEPRSLVGELLPALSAWAETLLAGGFCHRLSLDTYERELERYGGEAGIDNAEEIFCADSEATTELLALLTRGMWPPIALGWRSFLWTICWAVWVSQRESDSSGAENT
jgi:thiopeptide-type bacteriocin biosynthesis protein